MSVKNLFAIFLLVNLSAVCGSTCLANKKSNNFAGIEIGTNGVKFAVLKLIETKDANVGLQSVSDSTINTNIYNFSKQAGNETLAAILYFYKTAAEDFNIDNSNIYISISSSIINYATAINKLDIINDLHTKLKLKIDSNNFNWEVVSTDQEADMSFHSIVSVLDRQNFISFNIGNASIIGGGFRDDNITFQPYVFNQGSESLLKKMIKTLPSGFDKDRFYNQLELEIDSINHFNASSTAIFILEKEMKKKIVFSGGISWAISSLIEPNQNEEGYLKISIEKLNNLMSFLNDNFDKKSLTANLFTQNIKNETEKAIANAKLHQILKIYDTKTLICGAAIISSYFNRFGNPKSTPTMLFSQNGRFGCITKYIGLKISK